MKSICINSDNYSDWNSKNYKNELIYLDLECCYCSSYGKFLFEKSRLRWAIDVDIPYGWEFGQWSKITIFPVQINILTVKCEVCNEKFQVKPSFVLKGTRLTAAALVFTIFVYEVSELTWRDIPKTFCKSSNMIAHSTFYRAAHGLGKSIVENINIEAEIQALKDKYLFKSEAEYNNLNFPPEKSIFEHTIHREVALRDLFLPMVSFKELQDKIYLFFFKYVRSLKIIFTGLDPPVSPLYA